MYIYIYTLQNKVLYIFIHITSLHYPWGQWRLPPIWGSDFPIYSWWSHGSPVSRLKFSSLRWFGFNKPKEHDEHILVPGLEKICIYTHIHMSIYIYNIWDNFFNFHQSISLVPSSKLSVSSVEFRCLQNAGPKLALGKHVKSPGGRGGSEEWSFLNRWKRMTGSLCEVGPGSCWKIWPLYI